MKAAPAAPVSESAIAPIKESDEKPKVLKAEVVETPQAETASATAIPSEEATPAVEAPKKEEATPAEPEAPKEKNESAAAMLPQEENNNSVAAEKSS